MDDQGTDSGGARHEGLTPQRQAALQRMLEVLPQAAFVAAPSGHLLLCNARFGEALQVVQPEGLAWTVRAADPVGFAEHWQTRCAAGIAFDETLHTQPTGWLSMQASPVLDLGLARPGWLVTVEASRSFPNPGPVANDPSALGGVLASQNMGLWEWDPASDEANWNEQLYHLLRIPRGAGRERGARFLEHVAPEDRRALEAGVARMLAEGFMPPQRFRVLAGDGSVRWLMSCAEAVRDAAGQVVKAVGINFDVTEQAEAEALLGEARQQERLQSHILDAVLQHVPIGLAVALPGEQDISLVSRFGIEMIEAHGDTGRQWDAWQVYHLDGRTPLAKEQMALHRAVHGEEVRNEEWLIRTANGTLLPVSCNAGPIRTDDGALIGGVVAWYDVSLFKRAEDERRHYQEALLESERAARRSAEHAGQVKDEFLATLSHELRTPLSAISGWVHVLRHKLGASHPDLLRGIEVIDRSTKVQLQLIEDLLDMSRITSGKLLIERVPLAPVTVVQAAVDVIAPSAEAAGVTLAVALDATPGVLGDASRLQQVVWNLLANAVKFTPRGGHVQVTLRDGGDHVEIGVSDSGVGISPDMLPHIFDRFRQADGSVTRRFGGLGLGLSIVRTLVELHHGSVEVHSDGTGHGASFTVRLPGLALAAGALRVPEAEADEDDTGLAGLDALVVDDDDNARELLGRILAQHGVQVRACENAAAALAQLGERVPDVLISDIGMPGLDGYSFLEQVRRLPAGQGGQVPAIALTAFARPEDRRRALAIGYQEHLTKPLEPGRLMASLRRLRR